MQVTFNEINYNQANMWSATWVAQNYRFLYFIQNYSFRPVQTNLLTMWCLDF